MINFASFYSSFHYHGIEVNTTHLTFEKTMLSRLLLTIFTTYTFNCHAEPSPTKLNMLYNRMDPTSISQHLAFYELYGNTSIGKKALQDAWELLAGKANHSPLAMHELPLPSNALQALISLVNKPIDQEVIVIDDDTLALFAPLSARLAHSTLKGHLAWSEEEVLQLPLEEIDLARGLLLSQFGADKRRIQSYEALIDLMALQILARLPSSCSDEDKIRAINAFIFDEMNFRFPPHSLSTKEIDLYSFLPSVIDSHRGVCLGVSLLYICLAQRLALPLEMVTPPGHIYVRYRKGDQLINIETTARGIHLDCDDYLSVNTCALQQRTIREVIGTAHFNQASLYWRTKDYEKVLTAYQKAEPYMRDDAKLKELMGFALILTGQKEAGEKLLRQVKDFVPEHAVTKGSLVDDYLEGRVDAEGVKLVFAHAEEDDRASLVKQRQEVEKLLERYPTFRMGWLSLAISWVQLHRAGEALEALNTFLQHDAGDPEVHYYLAALYAQRHDFSKAWHHLHQAEGIVQSKNYAPTCLKELRRQLLTCCPE